MADEQDPAKAAEIAAKKEEIVRRLGLSPEAAKARETNIERIAEYYSRPADNYGTFESLQEAPVKTRSDYGKHWEEASEYNSVDDGQLESAVMHDIDPNKPVRGPMPLRASHGLPQEYNAMMNARRRLGASMGEPPPTAPYEEWAEWYRLNRDRYNTAIRNLPEEQHYRALMESHRADPELAAQWGLDEDARVNAMNAAADQWDAQTEKERKETRALRAATDAWRIKYKDFQHDPTTGERLPLAEQTRLYHEAFDATATAQREIEQQLENERIFYGRRGSVPDPVSAAADLGKGMYDSAKGAAGAVAEGAKWVASNPAEAARLGAKGLVAGATSADNALMLGADTAYTFATEMDQAHRPGGAIEILAQKRGRPQTKTDITPEAFEQLKAAVEAEPALAQRMLGKKAITQELFDELYWPSTQAGQSANAQDVRMTAARRALAGADKTKMHPAED